MKNIILILFGIFLTGCVTDESKKSPHNNLVSTVWKLKTDAYVIRYDDQRRQLYITPNTEGFGVLRDFSIGGKPYDESNIGRKVSGLKIVGGLRAGETLEVVRVLKRSNFEMGTSYWPMMILSKDNKWTNGKELNGSNLYYGRDKSGILFYDQGVLNSEYAEQVTKQDANQRLEPTLKTPDDSVEVNSSEAHP